MWAFPAFRRLGLGLLFESEPDRLRHWFSSACTATSAPQNSEEDTVEVLFQQIGGLVVLHVGSRQALRPMLLARKMRGELALAIPRRSRFSIAFSQ